LGEWCDSGGFLYVSRASEFPSRKSLFGRRQHLDKKM